MAFLGLKTDRKLCVYYTPTWKRRCCALPFHPSCSGASGHNVPNLTHHKPYRRFITLGKTSLSPNPIEQDLGELPLPPVPNPCIIFCKINHQSKERSYYPSNNPMIKGRFIAP